MNLPKALFAAAGFATLQAVLFFALGGAPSVFGNFFSMLFGLYRGVQGFVNWLMIRKKQRQAK